MNLAIAVVLQCQASGLILNTSGKSIRKFLEIHRLDKNLLSDLLRIPLDPIETMVLLDVTSSTYIELIKSHGITFCSMDREIVPPLIKFHNFWNLFEYRIDVNLRDSTLFLHTSVNDFLDWLAKEIDVIERADDLSVDIAYEIICEFFLNSEVKNDFRADQASVATDRMVDACVWLSDEFKRLLNRVDEYFASRVASPDVA